MSDAEFLNALRARTEHIAEGAVPEACDMVLLGAESSADLAGASAVAAALKAQAALWIVYPKGRKHITEAQVRQAGLAAGLVDNKIVSFSSTHTALRFVIRLSDRIAR